MDCVITMEPFIVIITSEVVSLVSEVPLYLYKEGLCTGVCTGVLSYMFTV